MLRILAMLTLATSATCVFAQVRTVSFPSDWRVTVVPISGETPRRHISGSSANLQFWEGLDVETWSLDEEALRLLSTVNDQAPIVRLRLMSNFLADEGFEHVCNLPQLRDLEISARDSLTSNGFRKIARLKGLQCLRLDGFSVDDVGLQVLSELRSLKHLEVRGLGGLTGDCIRHAAKISGLQSIDLTAEHPVESGWLAPLTEHPGIKDVTLRFYGNGKFGGQLKVAIACLGSVRGLRSLSVRGAKSLEDGHLLPLTRLPNLEKLRFYECPVLTGTGFGEFARSGSLRSLSVWHCFVSDAGAAAIGRNKSLTELWLGSCNFSDAACASLSSLNNLKHLYVGFSSGVTGAGLAKLGALTGLEKISLAGTSLDRTGARMFLGMKQLTEIDASHTSLDSEAMVCLKDMFSLRELDLFGCENVGDRGLAALANLEQLEDLDLSRTGVTGRGLMHLGSLKKLRHLKLSRTGVTDDGLAFLRDLHLETLDLEDCRYLTEKCLEDLAVLPRLKSVILRGCRTELQHESQLTGINPSTDYNQPLRLNPPLNPPPGGPGEKREPPPIPEPADPPDDESKS